MRIHEFKKHCKLMSLIAVLALSGCASKVAEKAALSEIEAQEIKNQENEMQESETPTSEMQESETQTETTTLQGSGNSSPYRKQTSISPFYGIWCGASKNESEATNIASVLNQKGLNGQIFVTSDWSNLNSEKWYVVTAGIYDSKEAANAVLADVQAVYDSAYVKYSGNYIGNGTNTVDYSLVPFYGIWCGASKNESEATNIVSVLNQKGLNGQIFVTSDWSNLNSEKWYVVTVGIYDSKEAANAALTDVQAVYDSAYVKYSGDYIGTETATTNTGSSIWGKYAGDYYAGRYFYKTITITRCDNGVVEGTYYSEYREHENTPVLNTDQCSFSVSINADNCFEIPERGEWYFTEWNDTSAIIPWENRASDHGESMEGDGPFVLYKID